jgi:hypothetical protein
MEREVRIAILNEWMNERKKSDIIRKCVGLVTSGVGEEVKKWRNEDKKKRKKLCFRVSNASISLWRENRGLQETAWKKRLL